MISRRAFLAMIGASTVASRANALPMFKGDPQPFDRNWLEAEAKRLSQSSYVPMPDVPQEWKDLDYDRYRQLSFDAKKALWSDGDRPFRMDFFHPGLYFPRPIEISIVENGEARMLGFDLSLFKAGKNWPEDMPLTDEMGYSGFRLRHELRNEDEFEEFMVFQGASYFRGLGTGQNYGLSARGLALRTGDPNGEEFPEFTRFWVEAPKEGERTIIVHALLDGPSTTGAYTFRITPALPTTVSVSAKLFPRVDLDHVGLGALTSMFLFDETNRSKFDDFRTAVHDNDGLLIANGAGELLWRPLANHRDLQISSFVDTDPRGFGLMQRTRRPEDFGDLEALYHNRPSLWITPDAEWGAGAVTLVEIPSEKEIYDNIVAYWRPRDVIAAGSEYEFGYDMAWGFEPPRGRDVARVLNTRIGKGYDKTKPYVTITVDFENHPGFGKKTLDYSDPDLAGLTKYIAAARGKVTSGILQRNPGTGGVRLAFNYEPEDAKAADMRVQLVKDGVSLTEVWLYRWSA